MHIARSLVLASLLGSALSFAACGGGATGASGGSGSGSSGQGVGSSKGSGTGTGVDIGTGTATGSGTGTSVGSGTGTSVGSGSGTGTWTGSGSGTGTWTGSGSGSGTWTGSGSGSGTWTGSGSGSGTWTGSGSGTGTWTGSGSGSGPTICYGDPPPCEDCGQPITPWCTSEGWVCPQSNCASGPDAGFDAEVTTSCGGVVCAASAFYCSQQSSEPGTCVAYPPECASNPTCACIVGNEVPCSCTETSPGAFVLSCGSLPP